MASTFTLTTDFTGPSTPTFAINGGAAATASTSATANFSTGDASTVGYQVKVWGAGLAGAPTEGGASWVAYNPALPITLSSGDGSKTVNAKIRDEVGNETAQLTDSISLDTVAPVPDISVAFAPTKISKVSGFDTSTGSFQSDSAIQAWKFKIVPATNSVHTAGTQIPTTNGSTNVSGGVPDSGVQVLAATTNQSVSIKGADVELASAPEGDKIVKLFVQDLAGNWSVV